MGDKDVYHSEALLADLGGCGKFQILLTTLIQLTAIPAFFSFNIDTFGLYNPGWKCVGNTTELSNNTSASVSTTTVGYNTTPYNTSHGITTTNSTANGISKDHSMWTEYGVHSCHAYEQCPNVEFSPDASTILTEWGLACNKGWIMSSMLSIRMAGYMCSTLVVGYIGDRFGRKFPFVVSRFIILAISLIMAFSNSWQMYAALLFVLGFVKSFGLLGGVIMTEYVNPDWRVKVWSIPLWPLASILFAVVAMYIHDWRILRLIAASSGIIAVIPLLVFMPESLRWLSVNGTKDALMKLITRIANFNKVDLPAEEKIDLIVEQNLEEKKKPNYTIFHLFRKGYRVSTTIAGFVNFSTDVVYFAFNFGVASLPGNFYTNLMIFSATDLPAGLIAFFFAHRYNRKPTMISMYGMTAICLFGIVAFDQLTTGDVKMYSVNALVNVAKLFLYIGWIVLATAQVEVFPTVIRTTINGFSFFCSSLGGLFSPYLLPSDPSTFYISYLAMAVLVGICTASLTLFPETKGKTMKDKWDDDDDNNDDDDDNNGIKDHTADVFVGDVNTDKRDKGKEKHLIA